MARRRKSAAERRPHETANICTVNIHKDKRYKMVPTLKKEGKYRNDNGNTCLNRTQYCLHDIDNIIESVSSKNRANDVIGQY